MNKKYLPLILLIGSALFLVSIPVSRMVAEIVEGGSWWRHLVWVVIEVWAAWSACSFMGFLATRESSSEEGIRAKLTGKTPLSIRLWQAVYGACLIAFIFRIQDSVSAGSYLDTYSWAWFAIVTVWLYLRFKSFHAWMNR